MGWLAERFGKGAARVILFLAIAAIVLALMFLAQCAMTRNAKTEANVSKGQAGASMASGSDAVDTVGNVQASEQATDQVTKENEDAIRNAEGADAPVAAPVRDAGLASLCRRTSYRDNPRCLQLVAPR